MKTNKNLLLDLKFILDLTFIIFCIELLFMLITGV